MEKDGSTEYVGRRECGLDWDVDVLLERGLVEVVGLACAVSSLIFFEAVDGASFGRSDDVCGAAI